MFLALNSVPFDVWTQLSSENWRVGSNESQSRLYKIVDSYRRIQWKEIFNALREENRRNKLNWIEFFS